VPHAGATVPVAQVPPLQHPPLHVWVASQTVVHTPPLQAVFAGQSAELVHPQLPVGQTWPLGFAAQLAHAAPVVPHAGATVPGAQVPPLQHPPLQGCVASHDVVQTPLLHAVSAGQSADVLQPQPAARHTCPLVAAVQLAQAAPDVPQAPLAVPATQVPLLQQPPLHGWVASHARPHRFAALHALFAGQSAAPLQPQFPVRHRWPEPLVVQSVLAVQFVVQRLLTHGFAPGQSADELQPQLPATQMCPLLFTEQSFVHEPHFAAVVRRSTSQPFVATPSQSAAVALAQAIPHTPPVHVAVVLAGVGHGLQPVPHDATEVSLSQVVPPHECEPGLQVIPHVPVVGLLQTA
jgi:hypothetical protein